MKLLMCITLLGGVGVAEEQQSGTCGGGVGEEAIRQLVVESESETVTT